MEFKEDGASHMHPKLRKPTNNSQFPSASMKGSVLTTIPILPPELITEILSRLPVKSLLKFRSVSKSWLALISSTEFINTHLSLSTNNNKDYTHHLLTMSFRAAMNGLYQYNLQDFTVSSLLYESVTEAFDLDYPYKKLHNHFSIVGSVNGLICLAIEEYDLVIWNPSIRKYKKLPDSKPAIMKEDCWPLYGFGYDELHDDYKVVAIFLKISVPDQVEVKIYSLQSDSWKVVGECPSKKLLNISGKFVNGKLFWVTHGPNIFNTFKDGNIISIDLADEKWGKVEQPSYGVENFSLRLGVFGSDFSVFCDNMVTHVDVWVMKVYGVKESWTKMLTIEYPDDPFMDYDYLLLPPSFISNKGEILVCFGSSKVMTYNPKNDTFRYSEVINFNFDGWCLAEIYVESLVCPLSTEDRKTATKRKAGKTQVTTIKQQITFGRETELVYLLQEYATRPSHFPFSHNMRYSIRNPEMHHQVLEIPDSRSHILSMCIMFDPDFQVLKLLSYIDFSVKSIDYEVLVQNEESSNSWRPLINLPQQRQGDTRMCNKQSKQIKVLFAMGTGYMLCEATANSGVGIDILDTVNDSYVWSYYFSYELLHERRLHILECKAIIR